MSDGAEIVEMLFGLDSRQYPDKPRHSVVIDRVDEVSGAPKRPEHVPGFWAWLTNKNQRLQRQYRTDHLRWVLNGKPTQQQATRFFFPSVIIDPNV